MLIDAPVLDTVAIASLKDLLDQLVDDPRTV